MKKIKFMFLLIFIGIIGALVMVSGIIPLRASDGHWAITHKILEFSMERSISTHALGTDVPELNHVDLIQRGAGHFEIGCRQCHGDVVDRVNVGKFTTPKAPFLPDVINEWKPEELFQIIKYGIKFTGMPAWPDQNRDDEVWSMVAFLKKMPGMSLDEYEKLTRRKSEEGPEFLQACVACHGADGNGRENGNYPLLSGQRSKYLENALLAYKNEKRHSGTMKLMASRLSDEMIRSASLYYSKQRRRESINPLLNQAAVKRGEKIAREGIPQSHVASCMSCHGPGPDKPKHISYPKLAGQPAEYLENQLNLFLARKRGGGKEIKLMYKAIHKLSTAEIKDVAVYYESLSLP